RAEYAVADVPSGAPNGHDLRILRERVLDLAVPRHDDALDLRGIEQRLSCEGIHPPYQVRQATLDDEVCAPLFECFDGRRRVAAARAAEHLSPTAIRDI